MTMVDPDERYSIDDVKTHPFFQGTKFPSYPLGGVDVLERLRASWRWGDTDIFIAKCMNEEIPTHSNHEDVDRIACQALNFKLFDDF